MKKYALISVLTAAAFMTGTAFAYARGASEAGWGANHGSSERSSSAGSSGGGAHSYNASPRSNAFNTFAGNSNASAATRNNNVFSNNANNSASLNSGFRQRQSQMMSNPVNSTPAPNLGNISTPTPNVMASQSVAASAIPAMNTPAYYQNMLNSGTLTPNQQFYAQSQINQLQAQQAQQAQQYAVANMQAQQAQQYAVANMQAQQAQQSALANMAAANAYGMRMNSMNVNQLMQLNNNLGLQEQYYMSQLNSGMLNQQQLIYAQNMLAQLQAQRNSVTASIQSINPNYMSKMMTANILSAGLSSIVRSVAQPQSQFQPQTSVTGMTISPTSPTGN